MLLPAVAQVEALLQALPCQPALGNGEAFIAALLASQGEAMRPLLAKTHQHATQKAIQATRRRTYQATVEAFIHNLNTMNSRAGA